MSYDNVRSERRPPGALRTAWCRFYSDASVMVGLYGCTGLAVLRIFDGWFTSYDTGQQFFGYQLLPPSWSRYNEASFFLGIDDLGRDVLNHLLSGVVPTVSGAFVAMLAATIRGLVLSTFVRATHGLRSAVLSYILDTLLAIPSLLLTIIAITFAGPSLSRTTSTVWLALLPCMTRSIYSMMHDELEREYVIAACLDDAPALNILWFAMMPNITAGLVAEITRALSVAILGIIALGFFNLDTRLLSSEWGAALGDTLELIYVAPRIVMLLGTVIMISVLLVNLLGDGARHAIIARVE